jgi:hypothetical protein
MSTLTPEPYDSWPCGRRHRYLYTENVQIAKFISGLEYEPVSTYEKGGYVVGWQFYIANISFDKVKQQIQEFQILLESQGEKKEVGIDQLQKAAICNAPRDSTLARGEGVPLKVGSFAVPSLKVAGGLPSKNTAKIDSLRERFNNAKRQ